MSESEIERNVVSELTPFFEYIRSMDKKSKEFGLFDKALLDFYKKMERVMEIMKFLILDAEVLAEDLESKKIREQAAKETIYLVFWYFGLLESVGNSLADFLVMLLVANGKDFHIESLHRTPRIRHATSVKDLEEERVPLTTKLNFMNENGLSQICSVIDTNFRNSIAHMKIDIEKGVIYVKIGNKRKPALRMAVIGSLNFLKVTAQINHLLRQLVKDLIHE